MLKSRIDTDRLRVSLCANQTWMAVAGVATNARTLARILFIDANAKRHVKWLQSGALKVIVQMLNPLLVADSRILVRRAGPRLGWIFAAIAVNLIEMFSFGVIGLQLVIADWPRQ